VNDALWDFSIAPDRTLPRLGAATISIPYDWLEGEPYTVTVLSGNGIRHAKTIDIAMRTPAPSARLLLVFALLGVYVGVAPVFLGLLWLPALRAAPRSWLDFWLALTMGLLVFLGIDTLKEALEIAGRVPSFVNGVLLVAFGAAATHPELGLAQFTLEAWVRWDGGGEAASSGVNGIVAYPVVTKGRGEADGSNVDCNYLFGIRSDNGRLAADFESYEAAVGGNNNYPVTGSTVVSSGSWHHVAATYDGTCWQLYLDGVADTAGTTCPGMTPRYDSIQRFAIATAINSTGALEGGFNGAIDEVRVWSYARSAAEIADKLHFDVRVIEALENADLPAMGAAVYARGHLRRYAEHLNLPAPELVAQYELCKDHPGYVPDLTRIAQAERARDPNRALRWVYVVAAGVIGLFAVWWVLQSPRGAANSPAPVATPQVAPSSSAAPASQAAPADETTPVPASPPVAGAASPTMTPADGIAAPAAAAEPARAADANTVKLGFRTEAECWVEVYDKEGRQLFFDLARRGTRQDVAGAGPLRLVLGNASAVRFELGGRALTVPAALQRKGTAFITISADGRIEQAR